jgi:hypothetical protein
MRTERAARESRTFLLEDRGEGLSRRDMCRRKSDLHRGFRGPSGRSTKSMLPL